MRKSGAVLGFFMVMGFSGILLFGCSDSDNSTVPAGIPTNRIYVMSAENGTLDPVALSTGERTVSDTAQSWEYKLTLKNVSEDTLWYTDRPDRKSGTETTEYFVQTLWPKVYVEIAPNAVLDGWIPPNESNDGLFCILEEPQYNAQTKELTFNVTLLDSTMDNKHPENPLTINDAKITILNNAEDQHSWSSAQVAATAYYETTETDGVYKLHLNNIFPDLFNLGNAPNRGAYIYPNKFFVESWPARFGDDPPNASMTSYSEDGTLNIHLLTLSDPVYDADTAILTYTATSLNGDTEQNQTQLISPTLFIDDAASYTIKVTNTNDSPLYVVGWNNAAPKTTFETDSGKNSYMLAKKGGDKNNHTFQVTIPWASGNVFGCWEDPKDTSITDVDAMQKICTMTEFTITPTIDGTYKGQLAIAGDLSCVNYISKPARYKAVGGKACNPATCEAGTDFDPAKIYPSPPAECPTKMVGETCLSAGFFCDPQKNPGGGTALNGDKDFCDKYKQTLTDMVAYCKENSLPCAAAEGSNTLDVYYCGTAGGWLSTAAGKPYCAALNRGLGYKDVVDQGEKRKPDFYTTEPYNAYSQFVHKTAGDIYGFSYDDYSGEASPYNSSGELGTQGSCGIEVEYGPKSE